MRHRSGAMEPFRAFRVRVKGYPLKGFIGGYIGVYCIAVCRF